MNWPTIPREDIPRRLYHGSDRSNVPGILATGLLPRRPSDHPRYKFLMWPGDWRDQADVEPAKAIFLTPYFQIAAAGREVVIEVKTKGLDLVQPHTPCTVCSLAPIPAKRIVRVLDRDGAVTWKRS